MDDQNILVLAAIGMGFWFLYKKIKNIEVGALPAAKKARRAQNKETWHWTDYKGNEREMNIERDVKYID